jgi:predicted dehydrogenase
MNNIVIIGAGQLGSRHLQALTLVKTKLSISLIDPSVDSINTALVIFNGLNTENNHSIETINTINELELKKIDVAIVATNSLVRRKVIEELSAKCEIKYLVLEKFLFPKTEDYKVIEILLESKKIKAWVNCPRRMFDFYKELKKEIKEISIISFSGSSWGLGSNGIHMLDLIAYLTDEFEFHLNSEFLDETIIKSKREGYIEFTGQFTGSTKSKNHSFTIASYKEEGIPFVMSVTSGEKSFIVSEVTKKQITFSNKSGFQAEEKTITIPFQSQLTNIIVEELLNSGNCELTSYKESSDIHLQYLNMLLNFMGQNTTNKTGSCLIT